MDKEVRQELNFLKDKTDELKKTKRNLDVVLILTLSLFGVTLLSNLTLINLFAIYLIIIFVMVYMMSLRYKNTILDLEIIKRKMK
jgi:hypothetical protein